MNVPQFVHCMNVPQFIYCVEGYLGCFQVLATTNKPTVDIHMQPFV